MDNQILCCCCCNVCSCCKLSSFPCVQISGTSQFTSFNSLSTHLEGRLQPKYAPKFHITSYRVANINAFTGNCSRGCGIVFDGENGEMHLFWMLCYCMQICCQTRRLWIGTQGWRLLQGQQEGWSTCMTRQAHLWYTRDTSPQTFWWMKGSIPSCLILAWSLLDLLGIRVMSPHMSLAPMDTVHLNVPQLVSWHWSQMCAVLGLSCWSWITGQKAFDDTRAAGEHVILFLGYLNCNLSCIAFYVRWKLGIRAVVYFIVKVEMVASIWSFMQILSSELYLAHRLFLWADACTCVGALKDFTFLTLC